MAYETLSIGQCAARTGLTVRTLRHWESLGLVTPMRRADSPHRVYRAADLERLNKIVLLKKLGFALADIGPMLGPDGPDLFRMLQVQLIALQRRRRDADEASRLIQRVLAKAGAGETPDLDTLCSLVRCATRQENDMTIYEDMWRDYYSQDKVREIEARAAAITPDQQDAYAEMWRDLIADIEAAADGGMAPDSAPARALLQRYRGLIATFTRGDPEIEAGLKKMYADAGNWPQQPAPHFSGTAMAFLKAAGEAEKD